PDELHGDREAAAGCIFEFAVGIAMFPGADKDVSLQVRERGAAGMCVGFVNAALAETCSFEHIFALESWLVSGEEYVDARRLRGICEVLFGGRCCFGTPRQAGSN